MSVSVKRATTAVCVAAALSGCATTYTVNPATGSQETIRYTHGLPTMTEDSASASIAVTPLGFSSAGQLKFGVACFNRSGHTVDFGLENVSLASADGTPLAIFTPKQLERQARNRATAATVFTLVAGGLAGYAAVSNSHYTSRGYVATPHGTTRFSERVYDPGLATAGVALSAAATGATVSLIHDSLDRTLASLNGQMLETTTLDSGSGIGGVVIGVAPRGDYPQTVDVRVSWNGDAHDFRFTITQDR